LASEKSTRHQLYPIAITAFMHFAGNFSRQAYRWYRPLGYNRYRYGLPLVDL
jgi:hypothetical protein